MGDHTTIVSVDFRDHLLNHCIVLESLQDAAENGKKKIKGCNAKSLGAKTSIVYSGNVLKLSFNRCLFSFYLQC